MDSATPKANVPPVSPEVQEQFLEPCLSAVCAALHEGANIDAFVRSISRQGLDRTLGEMSAEIRLLGEPEGALVVSCSTATAAALAERVLNDVRPDPDAALIQDCLGEIANILAGQVKAALAGTSYHFGFSTPIIIAGAGQALSPKPQIDCLVIALSSDVGDLALQLFLTLDRFQLTALDE